MRKSIWRFVLILLVTFPSLSFAKGIPLFLQTGDELFEIEGSPTFEEGYSVGYACQRFGLLGADVWTWDCEIMAVNLVEFSVGELDPEFKSEMEETYSLSDRVRSPWNQYGIAILVLVLVVGIAIKVVRSRG